MDTLPIPQLQTQRLLLRAFRPTDLDAYAEMYADPEVMRHLGNGQPVSRSEAWRNMAMLIGHWYLRGFGMWAVEERQSGAMIGRIGLWQPEGWPGLEIGWVLRRGYWGQGYATEGAKAALAYAFTQLQPSHIISLIYPDNLASQRVAQKLGETLEDTIEIAGHPVLVFGISRVAFQSRNPSTDTDRDNPRED